jgi:hypothetical protein
MKKLLFTAIAMVAFSSASMANTIADEEIIVDNKKSKALIKRDPNECLVAKFNCYVDARRDGFSVEVATQMSYSIYFTCMGLAILEL